MRDECRATAVKIILFKGMGTIASLIKWQSRSEYSHAAILFEDGVLYEAREFEGVRKLLSTAVDYGQAIAFGVPAETNVASVRAFMERQLGKRYDYGSILRFITRQQQHRTDSGRWFCSELVFAAVQKGGVDLLSRVEPWAVSPGLLTLSPLLKPVL